MSNRANSLALASTLLFTSMIGEVHATLINNGELNGMAGISSLPTEWQASTGTSDLTNPGGVTDSGFIYANGAPASPNGGSFVIVESSNGVGSPEGIQQTVSGLTSGATYEVSFYQSLVGLTSIADPLTPLFTDPSQWSVSFGSDTQLSAIETFAGLGTQTWTFVSMIFTANSETEVLSFTSFLTPGSTEAYLGLDGVAVNAVPIPAAIWLFGAGLFGLLGFTKRKKS